MEPIQNVAPINNSIATKIKQSSNKESVDFFKQTLTKAVNQVDNMQKDAQIAVEHTVLGENQDIHRTILAIQKADVSLKLAVEVRNKALDAYQEIMRMPV